MESCKNCKYWNSLEKEVWKEIGKQMGECRRNSPTVIFSRHLNLSLYSKWPHFPWTDSEEWCGDYKSNKQKWWWYYDGTKK